MSSIQERLQLKRVPLDKWSIREKLCLASAVVASGDQNWMSVSRAVRMLCGTDRPSDWFSQKSCAAQYGKLLENVETPKRKKRTEKDNVPASVETPGESIVRKLLQERTDELNKQIQQNRQDYLKIKDAILMVQSGNPSDSQLEEMWAQIEIEKRQQEKEQQQRAQWLKEREERKIEMERAWRPAVVTNIMSSNIHHSTHSNKLPPLNVKIKTEDYDPADEQTISASASSTAISSSSSSSSPSTSSTTPTSSSSTLSSFPSKQGTSPLLTSLLKSPSPAPNSSNSVLHPSINSSNATRVSAPTITNLLTGIIPNISANHPAVAVAVGTMASTATTTGAASGSTIQNISATTSSSIVGSTAATSSFPLHISKQPLTGPPAQSTDTMAQHNITIVSPSQAAPTLSMLLENKKDINSQQQQQRIPPLVRIETKSPSPSSSSNSSASLSRSIIMEQSLKTSSSPIVELQQQQQQQLTNVKIEPDDIADDQLKVQSVDSPLKEDDQHLMEVFNGLIPDNLDELADINAIILNSELLEEESILDDALINEEEQHQSQQQQQQQQQEEETISDQMEREETAEQATSISITSIESTGSPGIGVELNATKPISLEESSLDVQAIVLSKDTIKQEELSDAVASPAQSDSVVVIIRDDENSDQSNDIPLAKLITQKSETMPQATTSNTESKSIVKKEEPDVFESDSNDDKCLESIKREIRSLSSLKENSDNSNEAETEKVSVEQKSPENKLSSENEIIQIDNDSKMEEIKCSEDDKPMIDTNVNDNEAIIIADTDPIDDVVEIKDDKSDDGKQQETVIIIEENDDDTNSLEAISDDVKVESMIEQQQPTKSNALNVDKYKSNKADKSGSSDVKGSSDEECFEDARDHLDDDKTKPSNISNMTKNDDSKSVDDQTITIIDTDDDSPAEANKEEKSIKARRDYSRKKSDHDKRSQEDNVASTSGDIETKPNLSVRMKLKERERSESPYVDDGDNVDCTIPRSRRRYSSTPNIDSLPNSPASSDDREYRTWKKSILIVYNRLSNHKYSGQFLKNTSDQTDAASGTVADYKTTVLRPMDLQTIKKNIENGIIRTTVEFQRDVMLMCLNAIMYNCRNASMRSMAEELMNDAIHFIEITMEPYKKEHEKSSSVASGSSTSSSSGSGAGGSSGGGSSGGGGSGSNTKSIRGRKSPRLPIL